MGNNVYLDAAGIGLFFTSELGMLPNPFALILNLFFIWWGYLVVEGLYIEIRMDHFNYKPKPKSTTPNMIKTVLKYIAWYILMIGFFGIFTLFFGMLIIYPPLILVEWLFDVNITPYFDYYFDKIIVSGSNAFSYLKVWLVGIPTTYFYNIKEHGWKIRG